MGVLTILKHSSLSALIRQVPIDGVLLLATVVRWCVSLAHYIVNLPFYHRASSPSRHPLSPRLHMCVP